MKKPPSNEPKSLRRLVAKLKHEPSLSPEPASTAGPDQAQATPPTPDLRASSPCSRKPSELGIPSDLVISHSSFAPPGERRLYQAVALEAFLTRTLRLSALLWERQSGKSSTIADMSLHEMTSHPGRTCIYASASLLLAQELVFKQTERLDRSYRQLIEKEALMLQAAAQRGSSQAASAGLLFQTADATRDRLLPQLKPDDFADLLEAQKLEFRVYHDRTTYSRTKIIAPNIATARSWSGTVFLDEIAFIRDLRELMVALLPVISTDPSFKLVLATTPPEYDDTHYSFELLAPPTGLLFPPNAAGNWYQSQAEIDVHRVDAHDSFLAGKKIFDLRSGKETNPQEAFAHAPNKTGHRIAHFLEWLPGGTAACDLLRLKIAQERGTGKCAFFAIENDAQFTAACKWLRRRLDGAANVGLGFDPATTTRGTSNPSALAVVEAHPPEFIVRAIFVWKTRDPGVARGRLRAVIETVSHRLQTESEWETGQPDLDVWDDGSGANEATKILAASKNPERAATGERRPIALALDATNERYFAEDLRNQFRQNVPVLLVVASEAVRHPELQDDDPPNGTRIWFPNGDPNPSNWKEFLGDQYVGLLNDNHLTLPCSEYVRADHRLVTKDRGRFVCQPDAQGRHGDTFDAAKLGVHALSKVQTGASPFITGPALGICGRNWGGRPLVPPVHPRLGRLY